MTTAPSPAQLANSGLVALPNNAQITIKNGWALRFWNVNQWALATEQTPIGTQLYAVPQWQTPRYAVIP